MECLYHVLWEVMHYLTTNIVYPVVNIMIAIATMMATGGNAIISKYLGEGKKEKAKERLTMFVVITLIVSGIIMLVTLSIFKSDLLYAWCYG